MTPIKQIYEKILSFWSQVLILSAQFLLVLFTFIILLAVFDSLLRETSISFPDLFWSLWFLLFPVIFTIWLYWNIFKNLNVITLILGFITNWIWLNSIIDWYSKWSNDIFDYNIFIILICIFTLYFILAQIQTILYINIKNKKYAFWIFIIILSFICLFWVISEFLYQSL